MRKTYSMQTAACSMKPVLVSCVLCLVSCVLCLVSCVLCLVSCVLCPLEAISGAPVSLVGPLCVSERVPVVLLWSKVEGDSPPRRLNDGSCGGETPEDFCVRLERAVRPNEAEVTFVPGLVAWRPVIHLRHIVGVAPDQGSRCTHIDQLG